MRRVLATTLMPLLIAGSALPAFAAPNVQPQVAAAVFALEGEPGDGQDKSDRDAADQDAAAPPETDPQDKAGANDGLMKNFTRHRPGACPEGPPCPVVDGD
ncbi:MAG TPA: hypothetical protein VMW57_08070 [Methyloceanibacter sp.]|nr:hypothetical protein [Methyloceanibacter sp.]